MTARSLRHLPLLGDLYARLEARPNPQPEHSLALRFLVQCLVAVGIVGTDIAAGTQMSFWAVPLSFLGAYWSWRQRNRPNTAAQFAIALGMLVALAAFFVRLLSALGDTRLTLAELLVHLQVLHSFDLPRRKDLGYSTVIGLILVGVAGTLSQTLLFGPVLVAFLAIALPVLVLDYRSRLGLDARAAAAPLTRYLPLRRLAALFLAIALLGLGLFAVMPRFPGYQLRTFPVSAPADLADRLFDEDEDPSLIRNPGYGEEGDEAGSGSGGAGGGQMDDTFYYGFSSAIDQNLRGQLTPQTVMRVRSQAPGFWRVLAFDRYTGQGWEISRNDNPISIGRSAWSYRFLLPPAATRNRTREVIQSYTVVSTLPNLIPALARPRELYFPTREVAIDAEGGLRSPRVLDDGLTYTVVSQVPYRDRTALRTAGRNYPPDIEAHYLGVPAEVRDRLRQKAEELLAKADPPRVAPAEQALYLAQALKQTYEIRPDIPPLEPDRDLAEAFLFDYGGGYPDHFATTLAVMLRSLDIPARLAVGFSPGQFNPFTGLYEVKNTDAHAIVEVYFPGYGWFAFDPIPGHPLVPPSVEENQTFALVKQFWSWVAGWLPAPLRTGLESIFAAIGGAFVRAVRWLAALAGRGWAGALAAGMLAIAASFLLWLLWKLGRAWAYRRRLASLPPVEALYRQAIDAMALEGCPKEAAQTPLEYLRACETWAATAGAKAGRSRQVDALAAIVRAYSLWRYGGGDPAVATLQRQWQQARRGIGRSRSAAS